jgi:hypothetical protein
MKTDLNTKRFKIIIMLNIIYRATDYDKSNKIILYF